MEPSSGEIEVHEKRSENFELPNAVVSMAEQTEDARRYERCSMNEVLIARIIYDVYNARNAVRQHSIGPHS